jgi:hypothetical protein
MWSNNAPPENMPANCHSGQLPATSLSFLAACLAVVGVLSAYSRWRSAHSTASRRQRSARRRCPPCSSSSRRRSKQRFQTLLRHILGREVLDEVTAMRASAQAPCSCASWSLEWHDRQSPCSVSPCWSPEEEISRCSVAHAHRKPPFPFRVLDNEGATKIRLKKLAVGF